MDVVESFLHARRCGNANGALELVAPNASISFPWGGLRSGQHVQHYLRNETTFAHKEYLSSSVEIKEVAENTFQRVYKWDNASTGPHNNSMPYKIFGGKMLPTFREVYFVRDGKIAHVATNKDPDPRNLAYFFTHYINPFAKMPVILYQNTKL